MPSPESYIHYVGSSSDPGGQVQAQLLQPATSGYGAEPAETLVNTLFLHCWARYPVR